MRIRRRHWLLSIALAVAAHAAILLGVALRAPVPIGSGGGVRIALGDAVGTRPTGPSATETVELPEPRAAEPSPPPEPPPVAAAPIPVQEKPPAEEPVAEKPPEAQPAESSAPRPEAPADAKAPESHLASQAPGPPSPAASAASPAPPGEGVSGPSDPGERGLDGLDPDYVRRFMARLERYKQYPRAARAHHLEGTALLWLRVDREGRVLAYEVEESSGHRLLDRAVLRAIERANPLPPLPSSYPRAELEVVVPVAFRLQ
jgi:periplasmic protein TonB